MAIAEIPLPEPSGDFAAKCKEWMRRTEQQTALARGMIERVQKMRDRAEEMRKPPNTLLRALRF